jgi:hypothetical protein
MSEERFLEQIRIASPCTASWDEMTGDQQVRFCQQCQLSVYNISEMSRQQAEDLVREREGRLCIRMFQRQDGTVITQDCPVGLRKLKAAARRAGQIAAGIVALLMTVAGAKAAPPQAKDGGKTGKPQVTTPKAPATTNKNGSGPGGAGAGEKPNPRELMGDVAEPRAKMGEAVAPASTQGNNDKAGKGDPNANQCGPDKGKADGRQTKTTPDTRMGRMIAVPNTNKDKNPVPLMGAPAPIRQPADDPKPTTEQK